MKTNFLISAFCVAWCSITPVCAQQSSADKAQAALFQELQQKDSLLFDFIFNSCAINKLQTVLSKDFVMLYDNGLKDSTTPQSYDSYIANIMKGCDKKRKNEGTSMRREVVKGSLQVFNVTQDIAVQTGVQRFFTVSKEGTATLVEESKFLRNWQQKKGEWKMITETDFKIDHNPQGVSDRYVPDAYVPASEALYNTVVELDSLYFDTYNNCKMDKMAALTADDIEFYHDGGGLTTSKKDLIASIQKNICGKVTRILSPNSIEVYEIPGYGAVEVGYHSFRNSSEPGESHPSKFITLWRFKDKQWQMARVVSLH
ncbi:nuclear transport factor 2 family protein [Flavobacterium kingsejongi]|uniref:DUF4440 domain-containing protein n=1 Tax=Flavobacterium kingsejongi TaxID=1678728 RepID=A0A2S1LQH3_9FLAO|nr:nuclear transport factor 2 family protein [Flavobacterium kingsejongi]AWG25896.1 hypothetical protein FK004_12025 [Flavobacterium kingsejongi]